jgi:hypothetical protein
VLSPWCLGHQFPLKNPQESQEKEPRSLAGVTNEAPKMRRTYWVPAQGGSVGQGGSGQRRACIVWKKTQQGSGHRPWRRRADVSSYDKLGQG